jgi:DNA-binding protein H-NS
MKPHDLKSMSVDELWSLHEFVSAALARKIPAETARLNQRLRQLGLGAVSHNIKEMSHARRPYPQVSPKYRNPAKLVRDLGRPREEAALVGRTA